MNMEIKNTLIDNSKDLKLVDFINNIIEEKEIDSISIATGYWDLKGTSLITNSLNKFLQRQNTTLRILIGKDPNLYKTDLTTSAYKTAKKYPQDYLKIDLQNVELTNQKYQQACNLLIKYCEQINEKNNGSKIQIRIFDTNEDDEKQFFHSKCYIFDGKQNGVGYGIIGSSNFTENGLSENSELNYLTSDIHSVLSVEQMGNQKSHLFWFNEKWNLAKDWTKEFVIELKTSPIGKKITEENQHNSNSQNDDYTILTPQQIYNKFLIDQFDQIITSDGKIKPEDYMPHDKEFMKLTYQEEAVNQAFPIMQKHHGVIIADVVGLGKTFTALMIIKRHLLETGFTQPILIITPPAIKQSWIDSINYFDKDEVKEKHIRPYITLTTIGTLDSELEDEQEQVEIDDFDSSFTQNNFCMIVVDESHRFKNNTTLMYQKLDNLIGELENQPYIVLLSATPQNNTPRDLYNQICLFQREKIHSTLNLGDNYGDDLEKFFYIKDQNYREYIKKDKIVNGERQKKSLEELEQDKKNLVLDTEEIRKLIVEPLVIRRTRTDIERFYNEDKASQKLVFPKIQPPVDIPYEMSGELAYLFTKTISIIAPTINKAIANENGQGELGFDDKTPGKDGLGFYRYQGILFLKDKNNRKLYEDRSATVEKTSERLEKLMELLLVKRLESSQAAFKESLHNLKRYTQNMIKMWDANRIFICPDLDVNKELSDESITKNGNFEGCLNKLEEKAKAKNKKYIGTKKQNPNKEYTKNDFKEEYFTLLQNDLRIINELCDQWDKHTNDPKMNIFLKRFESIFMNKEKNPTQKLVIFTECIATQKAIIEKLDEDPSYKYLSVTAKNRDELKEVIAQNFDANYKGTQKDDYQILVTTDVLAEGVNLHRANSILNYDSPWNATRLMQRLGRINRIGSKSEYIWNYNFYPSTLGDNQINLKNRTYVKLQAFHELFGEDSQIYSKEENVKHFDKVNRESFEDSESPIMPFIAELKNFKAQNETEYNRLKNIQNTAISFVNDDFCFTSVHEEFENQIKSTSLYKVQNTGLAKRLSQIEFFEELKEVAKNNKNSMSFSNQNSMSFSSRRESLQKYERAILSKLEAEKQNSSQNVKSKSNVNKKDYDNAIEKIKSLQNQENISDELFDILDDVKNSIRNKNSTLIKKVLELNLEQSRDGLFKNCETEILSLQKYVHPKPQEDNTIKIAIALVGE